MLVEIENAEATKTRQLLGLVLAELNVDNRVKFYTSRGKGKPTVQCLRVMLSRVRAQLEAKGIRRKQFRLQADVFPWTERDGTRKDCVILSRHRTTEHEILETLEDLMTHGTTTR